MFSHVIIIYYQVMNSFLKPHSHVPIPSTLCLTVQYRQYCHIPNLRGASFVWNKCEGYFLELCCKAALPPPPFSFSPYIYTYVCIINVPFQCVPAHWWESSETWSRGNVFKHCCSASVNIS